MHCPNCGNESGLDHKFCRKCGFNLEPVGKLMMAGGEDDEPKLSKVERDKLIMRRMVSWMMWGMLFMLIGIVLNVVNKQFDIRLFHLFPLNLISTLLILGGVSVVTYGVLDAMRGGGAKKRKSKVTGAPLEMEIEKAQTTKELEGRSPIPIASVTERTTQLIGIESDQRNRS